MEFETKLITRNDLSVIAFKGRMSKEAREELKKCQEEILNSESKIIILLFKDLITVDMAVYRELTMLQQEIRKAKQLYLVGFNKALKQLLIEKGIIRLNEVKETLEDALKSI
ncbi:MAG: hypothetical protein NDI69_01085 [Bacteriovoracaceae bacterium]|nr:hypothetical protein [Bacteriovoracaceae bacterium]